MKKVDVLTAEQAAKLVRSGHTVAINGFIGSCSPEALNIAIEKRFLATGEPRDLTLVFCAGQGNRKGAGTDHFGHKGMVRRGVGGHWNMSPNLGRLATNNEIEAYNFPQGVISHLFREIAAGRPGLLTHVGLDTFVDPLKEGGKLNAVTTEDLVVRMDVMGRELLFYKAFPIDICLIRGTYADENGNIVMTREVMPLDATCIAQAVKNSGGKVIVQVERIVKAGTLDPWLVKVPGIYVDAVVVAPPELHEQCLGHAYDPTLSGAVKAPASQIEAVPLNAKKIIARRAAMELKANAVVNLGIGAPEYVAKVAAEEGLLDQITLTVESGCVGGMPQGGQQFGASRNAVSILDQCSQFDFYDGGGLDFAFLGLAQCEASGNVNVSKFGPRLAGCGGFIDITQNARRVIFCGTFTASSLKLDIQNGGLIILNEGTVKKFVQKVEQDTFSGRYALAHDHPVLFVTERAVFELCTEGLRLIEIAPGIEVERDILPFMEFRPVIDGPVKLMDARIFRDEPMGLSVNRIEW